MITFLSSRSLAGLAAILIVAGLVLLSAVVASGADAKINAASAILVAGAAIFAAAVKFHSEERDRAFKFLSENVRNAEIMSAMGYIGRLLAKFQPFDDKAAAAVMVSNLSIDRDIRARIMLVMNFFEEMAIGIKNQQINEDIVRDFYCGSFCRFYVFTEAFIPILRNSPHVPNHPFGMLVRPDVFENVEWLAKRWLPIYDVYLSDGTPASWAGHS